MRVLFWVPYPTEGPSNRYRVEQYLPYLEKERIEYTLHPFWSKTVYRFLHKKGNYIKKILYLFHGLFKRILDLFHLHQYDIVFIHREASPLGFIILEKIISFAKKAIVFDFDDSIFLPNFSEANRFLNFLKNHRKIPRIIKLSNLVIAGSNFLKSYASGYNENSIIIPTVIDTEKYIPRERIKDSQVKIVIGWMGSPTTIKYLDLIKDVFEKLLKKFDNIEIHIVGGKFESFSPHIISKGWTLETEISDLQEFDIGLMPISDDAWGQGKCAFKIIQYMSIGIPAVASPVGMNSEVIKDGINGFLAGDSQEWFGKLSHLINNVDLRAKLGAAGRMTVGKHYSLRSQLHNFINALRKFDKKINFQ